eukprot:TRINITY_DN9300_c0_g1_i1.p1 TRINITY_DN9300_c0_g1~~TRINITY_DN9300_c0_g1_i1.p1  ORF type:complete len:199 (+),score=30.57 TRINITY_DN9300_c0_g1_i1:37-633(+)
MSQKPDIQLGFFGSMGVGKTALVLRYMLGKFIEETDPTIEDIHSFEKDGIKLGLWDYASREDFGIRREFETLQQTQGIFLCFSHDNSGALNEIKYLYETLSSRPESEKALEKPIFVVRCKCDLEASKKPRDVKFTLDEVKAWAAEHKLQYWEVSAKEDIRVNECFEEMIKLAKNVTPISPPPAEKPNSQSGRANCCIQ